MTRQFATTTALTALLFGLGACDTVMPVTAETPAPTGLSATASDLTGDPWFDAGRASLAARMEMDAQARITGRARNVILFVADGMDPTTVTAARIHDGQLKGLSGEDNSLAFETLPFLAMAKTYTTNMQVPDSAGTATAMLTGVKTKSGVINITDKAGVGDCDAALANKAVSAAEMAERAGMAVGVISTARITHATPATVYAHSASRNWEATVPEGAEACDDIAQQLIDWPVGDGLELALGGGRRNFLPADVADPEIGFQKGARKDGRDLTAEWAAKSDDHVYVWNREQFDALPADGTAKVLGLFEGSHMRYELDRAKKNDEPSLAEMTDFAIDALSRDEDGFFLMVEGGRVDHAHHAGNAARALEDVRAFDAAVATALAKTDPRDTLIIVTADHGHTLFFQGYPQRGNPILGLTKSVDYTTGAPKDEPQLAADGKPFTTLSYGNGPGSPFMRKGADASSERPVLTEEEVLDPDFRQQSLVPTGSESHGGQDVTIYASGPYAWTVEGTVEQNYIFHVIEQAAQFTERSK